jgi:hypothetical protein
MDTMKAPAGTEARTEGRRWMVAVVVGVVALLAGALALRARGTGVEPGSASGVPSPADAAAAPGSTASASGSPAAGLAGAPATPGRGPMEAPVPGQGPGEGGAVTDLHTVDFANYRHPHPPCGVAPGQDAIELRAGTYESADGARLELQPVRYGDLTGDGQAEAVVLLACSGRDPRSSGCGEQAPTVCAAPHLRVYTLAGTGPKVPSLLAPLVIAGDPAIRTATGAEDLVMTTATIEDSVLVTGWSGYTATDPSCCPTRDVVLRHRWSGSAWVPAAAPQVQARSFN